MVPALGESVSEATVSTWFKKPGDYVKQDEMLCELETDKVSVEVPAPVSGTLAEILPPEGATVAANARLAIMTEGAAAAAPAGRLTMVQKVRLIEEAIEATRPVLKADGGDCELVDVEGRDVFVKLTGACAGCRMARMTVDGIAAAIAERIGQPMNVIPV